MKARESSTVVSSSRPEKGSRNVAWPIVVGVLLVAVGLTVAWVLVAKPFEEPKRLVESLPSGMDIDLGTTGEGNIEKVLAYKYNVKLDDLKSQPLGGRITSYTMARDVSTVFMRLENFDKSLEAFKIADQKKRTNDVNVGYYDEYCRVALAAGDTTLGKKQCQKAMDELAKYPADSIFRQEGESDIRVLLESYEVKL